MNLFNFIYINLNVIKDPWYIFFISGITVSGTGALYKGIRGETRY